MSGNHSEGKMPGAEEKQYERESFKRKDARGGGKTV